MYTVSTYFKEHPDIDKVIFIAGQYEVRMSKNYGIRHNLQDGVWNTLSQETLISVWDKAILIKHNDRLLSLDYCGKVTT